MGPFTYGMIDDRLVDSWTLFGGFQEKMLTERLVYAVQRLGQRRCTFSIVGDSYHAASSLALQKEIFDVCVTICSSLEEQQFFELIVRMPLGDAILDSRQAARLYSQTHQFHRARSHSERQIISAECQASDGIGALQDVIPQLNR